MKSDNTLLVATLTFLTLGMVVLLAIHWRHVPDEWQQYICTPQDCTLQQWLSSLAGWFGGMLAAAGALVVYWQLQEQKRQTGFLIGDGDPTVDIVCTAWDELSAFFRVVNWNRRLIVIGSIKFQPEPEGQPTILHTLRPGYDWAEEGKPEIFVESTRIKAGGELARKPDLAGWEDRSKPPCAKIFVLGFEPGFEPEVFGRDGKTIINVSFEIFTPGDHGRVRVVSVKVMRGNLFPRTQAMKEEYDSGV